MSVDLRYSESDQSKRDIPSFIEPRPPLIMNPFMRPRPQKATNLMQYFDEDSESEDSDWVKVYLRLKPAVEADKSYEVRSDRHLVTSVDTAPAGHGRRTLHNVSKMYTFSRIFGPGATQKEIFDQIVKENLKKLPEGHNFTLLTYGASGSGKTYTLMGTVSAPGLVPRSLEYVFKVVDAAQQPLYKPADNSAEKLSYQQQELELQIVNRMRNVSTSFREKYRRVSSQLNNDLTASTFDLSNRTRYYVWVSFVEIYNEKIYDLLSNSDRNKSTSNLQIREDKNGNVYVKGATQAFVRTGEEAFDVMVAGKYNLQVAATGVHAQSSRSHCIFTITMLTETECGVRSSCVRLCDLAGCERWRRTRNTGARMQESRAINASLHVLERCLRMLQRRQRRREPALVPYRESKLTRLLGAGLSGARNEAVSMVVALNPAPHYTHGNKHVLQLAAVAGDIQVNSTIAESTLESSTQDSIAEDTRFEMMKLREENDRLHFELADAQSCISKLQAAMDAKQTESTKTMYEVMEEAKDMTRQYYESLMESLRAEMDEMREDYEAQLKAAAGNINTSVVRLSTADPGTPSRMLLQKINRLETELVKKEEELNVERLARARLEEEVQHLLACINERDEREGEQLSKEIEENNESADESDSDEDDDPANQSLALTIKKKDLNHTRLHENTNNDSSVKCMVVDHSLQNTTDMTNDIQVESDDEQLEVTFKQVTNNDSQDESVETTTDIEADDTKEQLDDNQHSENDTTLNDNSSVNISQNISKPANTIFRGTYCVPNKVDDCIENLDNTMNVTQEITKPQTSVVRGTYFISNNESNAEDDTANDVSTNSDTNETIDKDVANPIAVASEPLIDEQKISLPGTYFFNDKPLNNNNKEDYINKSKQEIEPNGECDLILKNPQNNKYSIKLARKNTNSVNENDLSLEQFEQMEKALANVDSTKTNNVLEVENQQNCIKDNKPKLVRSDAKCIDDCDTSLAQFEVLEQASKDAAKVGNCEVLSDIKFSKDKNYFFDEKREPYVKPEYWAGAMKRFHLLDDTRSPSIVKDEELKDFQPDKIKKILGENLARPDITNVLASNKKVVLPKKHGSVDIFESPVVSNSHFPPVSTEKSNLKQVDEVSMETQNDWSAMINDIYSESSKLTEANENIIETELKIQERDFTQNVVPETEIPNTDTEVISTKVADLNITEPEATETKNEQSLDPVFKVPFNDTVFSRKDATLDTTSNTTNNTIDAFENIYKNLSVTNATTDFDELIPEDTQAKSKTAEKAAEKTKYNLRHRVTESSFDKKDKVKEVLLESQEKCESIKKPPKRNLRLRRRKNDEKSEDANTDKLQDIVNLQEEFSDVTLDVPVAKKEVVDIPSPEKVGEEENFPPNGIQSCPSKSVQRSRRKLFTPRAEVLEESLCAGDSAERVRVPRPSYHRGRARRKL